MSMKDVIKGSIYEKFAGGTGMSFWSVCVILLFACIIGIYIYAIYKSFSKSALYSKDLNITIAGVTVVIAAIMIAMQSNLIVSLGMVGALSIVRFRTAIKNPLDLLFLFWAVSSGIICGVGLYALGAALAAIMTILIYILNKLPQNKANSVLIVKCDDNIDQNTIVEVIKKNCKYYSNSSTVIRNGLKEMIFEVRTNSSEETINGLKSLDGIKSVSFIEHTGEMRI